MHYVQILASTYLNVKHQYYLICGLAEVCVINFILQIDIRKTKRIMALIESGKQEGARCVAGGARLPGKGFFIQPTVFADVEDHMRIG